MYDVNILTTKLYRSPLTPESSGRATAVLTCDKLSFGRVRRHFRNVYTSLSHGNACTARSLPPFKARKQNEWPRTNRGSKLKINV